MLYCGWPGSGRRGTRLDFIRIAGLVQALFFLLAPGCGPRPPALDFVPEMTRIPEVDTWATCEPESVAPHVFQAALSWIRHRDHVARQLTPDRIYQMARWAHSETALYRDGQGLTDPRFRAIRIGPEGRMLVLESRLEALPSHSPIVNRWLTLYLIYDMAARDLSRAIVTIRGHALE